MLPALYTVVITSIAVCWSEDIALEIAKSGANLVSRNLGCALADFYGHYSSRDLQSGGGQSQLRWSTHCSCASPHPEPAAPLTCVVNARNGVAIDRVVVCVPGDCRRGVVHLKAFPSELGGIQTRVTLYDSVADGCTTST